MCAAGEPSTTASTVAEPGAQPAAVVGTAEHHLYAGWRRTIPAVDHDWIIKTVFRQGLRGIEMRMPLKLWHSPPPPPMTYSQPPRSPDPFFASRLVHWAPYHMFQVKLSCPQTQCEGHRLTSSTTAYEHTVRQIVDIDSYYSMASEYLECTKCKKRYISWSDDILQQLDLAHQRLFPAVLTYRYVTM